MSVIDFTLSRSKEGGIREHWVVKGDPPGLETLIVDLSKTANGTSATDIFSISCCSVYFRMRQFP